MKRISIVGFIAGGLLMTSAFAIQFKPVTFAARWNADQTELAKVNQDQANIDALHNRALEIFRGESK